MFEELTKPEILARLEVALRRMPSRRRAIFLAIRLVGVSYTDLGEQMGLTPSKIQREVAAALLEIDDALRGRRRSSRWRRWWHLITGMERC